MKKAPRDIWNERSRSGLLKRPITHMETPHDLVKLMLDGKREQKDRQLNPTQEAYIFSDAKLKAIMGGAGSAKSSTGCADIIFRAIVQPGTKWFIARRDYNDLMDTTVRTMENILNNLPEGMLLDRIKQAPMKWWIQPARDGRGDQTPSEITFMGMTDQIRSYEFTGGFIDELDEVEKVYYDEMLGRLRWKPYPDFPEDNMVIGGAFNPPAKTHWLYTACTGLDATGAKIQEPTLQLFKAKPRENSRNLPSNYHDTMMANMSSDMANRLVWNEWGSTQKGDAVISQFNPKLHTAKGLRFFNGTLFRFWDFGYNRPAVLYCQVSANGRVQVLREFLGKQIEGTRFIDIVLRDTAEFFPHAKAFIDYGDPAVAQHKDTGSMLSLLTKAGVMMRYQRTPFDLSLQMLRKRFETLIEGEPAILIDERCSVLIDGLRGGYALKEDGETPRKDGVFDHEIDALRYGLWNLFGASMSANLTGKFPTSLASR